MDQQAADEGVPLNALGTTRLVSTRVPTDLARAVELAAAQELISVAAFARRAIAIAVRGSTRNSAMAEDDEDTASTELPVEVLERV
jgi:hypothetical protein